MSADSTSRRTFLWATAAGTAGVATWGQTVVAADAVSSPMSGLIQPGDVILFQGDSITDAGRSREHAGEPNQQAAFGRGYAWMAAASLLTSRPNDELQLFNRGISGNKVPQLADRWQVDCIDLKPDVLSILVGVNDLWHKRNGNYDGTVESYETGYRELLQQTNEALPEVKLVLCEPFLLNCGAVSEEWFPEFDSMRAIVQQLSDEFQTVFVPFHTMFDQATEYAPPEHWAEDGVHPTPNGAAQMAHHWLAAVYNKPSATE